MSPESSFWETVRIAVELAPKGDKNVNRYYQEEAEGIDPVLRIEVKCGGEDTEGEELLQ